MCEVKGRVYEVRLGKREESSYGMGGKRMRSLRSSNFSNPMTSRDWLQDKTDYTYPCNSNAQKKCDYHKISFLKHLYT